MNILRAVKVSVVHANIIDFRADALILKYAQSLFGADSAVYERLDPKQRAVPMPEIG